MKKEDEFIMDEDRAAPDASVEAEDTLAGEGEQAAQGEKPVEDQDDWNDSGDRADRGKRSRSPYVPVVQNMDAYFLAHYRDKVIQELNARIASGELSEAVEKQVVSEKIEPEECRFRRFTYWRLNRCDFLIDVELRLQLKVQTPSGVDTDFFFMFVELWFSFAGDEEACEFQDYGLREHMPDHDDLMKLDPHLVPILRRDEIEDYAEQIWEQYDPEAARDQRLRRPVDLARKMHLSVIELPLYNCRDTRAIIFFEDDTVLVEQNRTPGTKTAPDPVERKVPANTIVVKGHTGAVYGQTVQGHYLDIYHECIHYEWHYLFYRLQNMHNNDISKLKKIKRSEVKGTYYGDPTYYMEPQSVYGSFGLMMPRSFMVETVDSAYRAAFSSNRKDGHYDHDGRRYELIIFNIAEKYVLPKSNVRARLLQLGYSAAIGSANYVDGHYIDPFALSDPSSCTGDETYVISRKAVMELYRKYKDFRRIMDSGQFAYVDGHVVYCPTGNVITNPYRSYLSAWANAHIDRVSLRFIRKYTENHVYAYTFGRMNNKEALENTFKFLDLSGDMTVMERKKAADRIMEELPLSFHGALAYIMKGRCTVDELCERVPLSRSTLLRLRTEERTQYNLDQLVAICIGLHLPPWMSDVLLQRAHLTVNRYGENSHYGMILDCFYMDTIKEVQRFLKDNGFEPLHLRYEE